MKKSLLPAFLILLLLTMAGCGTNHTIAPDEDEPSQTASPEIDADGVRPGMLTFRAEVLDFDQYYLRQESLLFVSGLGHGRFFINLNDSIVVLDMQGEPVSYFDIPPGTVVDITFSRNVRVGQTDPAIISGATSIQIVEHGPPRRASPTSGAYDYEFIPFPPYLPSRYVPPQLGRL